MSSIIQEEKKKDLALLEREEYRVILYKEMGFSEEEALVLSKIRLLSPAVVRESFIKKGCLPKLAYHILRP